jgi:hypothetical protein
MRSVSQQPWQSCAKMSNNKSVAQVASSSIPSLVLDEVEEWEFDYYVVVKETSSSYKVYQLLIDKWTCAVMPEPGPNMAWSQKYGRTYPKGWVGA